MSELKIISQGAEATIFLAKNKIIKQRIPKYYRIPELDNKIRKLRTRSETKILTKASKIISCPIPEESKNQYEIIMPFIKGKRLSQHLDNFPLKQQLEICEKIGESVSKIHKEDLIHGDLTTSNMIYSDNIANNPASNTNNSINYTHRNNEKSLPTITSSQRSIQAKQDAKQYSPTSSSTSPFSIFFIDFGLGYQNGKYEDKAVDLHVLKQALEAKHFINWEKLWKSIELGYLSINKTESQKVLERLKAVEKRGRYKEH